jgi:hypothetical protein
MNSPNPLAIDQWLFVTLSGIEERETSLLTNAGRLNLPAFRSNEAGPTFGTLHMAEMGWALEHLRNSPGLEGISQANQGKLANITEILLRRQGPREPKFRTGYWLCVSGEDMPGDAWAEFMITYSTQVAAWLHLALENGRLLSKTKARITEALLTFFFVFARDGFPGHGHDIDLNYRDYARWLRLGVLDQFLVAHADDVPVFLKAAEGLVTQEAQGGPTQSPFLAMDPNRRFSDLGEFCLKVLGQVQAKGHRRPARSKR